MQIRSYNPNANNNVYPGLYYSTTDTLNAKEYGVILVVSSAGGGLTGSNWIYQIWLQTNGKIKIRYSINAKSSTDGNWTSWRDIGTSVLSGTTLTITG